MDDWFDPVFCGVDTYFSRATSCEGSPICPSVAGAIRWSWLSGLDLCTATRGEVNTPVLTWCATCGEYSVPKRLWFITFTRAASQIPLFLRRAFSRPQVRFPRTADAVPANLTNTASPAFACAAFLILLLGLWFHTRRVRSSGIFDISSGYN